MVQFLPWAVTTTLLFAATTTEGTGPRIHQKRQRRRAANRDNNALLITDANDNNDLQPLWIKQQQQSSLSSSSSHVEKEDHLDVGILSTLKNTLGVGRRRHLQQQADGTTTTTDEQQCDYLFGCAYFSCNSRTYQDDWGCDFGGFDFVTETGIITGCSYMFCKDCELSSSNENCQFCSLYSFSIGCGADGTYKIEYQGELACATWTTVCAATYTGSKTFSSGIQNTTDIPDNITTNIDQAGACSVDVLGIPCPNDAQKKDPAAIFTCPGQTSFLPKLYSCDEQFDGFPFRPTLCSQPRSLSNITGNQVCQFKNDGETQSSAISMHGWIDRSKQWCSTTAMMFIVTTSLLWIGSFQ